MAFQGRAGWPLTWQWHSFLIGPGPQGSVVWRYSGGRLAANAVMWLMMLALPATICEWLLRRYRPRPRWSLRTMLAAVALAAALCGWYAAARHRANVQEPLIAAVGARGSHVMLGTMWCEAPARVWVDHWGPDWLDLFGADRFCRQIVGADVGTISGTGLDEDAEDVEDLLSRLARLPQLQFLFYEVDRLRPASADALRQMRHLRMLGVAVDHLTDNTARLLADALVDSRQLRTLNIDRGGLSNLHDEERRMSHECLKEIGKLTQLEGLHLRSMPIGGESMACLVGLVNLTSLSLIDINRDADEPDPAAALLTRLPALPRVEALDLESSDLNQHDLRRLAVLPRLKSLSLIGTRLTGAALAELAALKSLEELAIDGDMISAAGLESLNAVKRLKTLHLGLNYGQDQAKLALNQYVEVNVPQADLDRCRNALKALQRSMPGIVIDADDGALRWHGQEVASSEYEDVSGAWHVWALQALRDWQ